jgi:glycosyltransferase involved in cell wall biosynthesis
MLSIIIPIYNSEKYLQKCLDSILSQTNKNFEVILIDDGCIDDSATICKRYCSNNSNFKYFYQKNGGPGAARNKGLRYSKGELISFIDPDDFVSSNYVETILRNMNSDLLFFSSIHQKINAHDEVHSFKNNTNVTFLSVLLEQHDYWDYGYTWNKCFRKDIIASHNLLFNENINHAEDELFTLEYAKHINLVNTINDAIYFYQVGIGISKKLASLNEFRIINSSIFEISNKFKDADISCYLKIRVINYWFNAYLYNECSFFHVYHQAKNLTDTLNKEELKRFLSNHSYEKHITLSKRTERFERIVLSNSSPIITKLRLIWLAFYEWQKIAIKKIRHKI